MARTTCAFLSVLCVTGLAAQAYPSDTGMLYVKSFPSGATVVIGDKERGKTPVLVRDLPAGDITVELRIAGVKPVTKQATVKANKVVTIDVAIEVPSATLTVVSEPLEATVILDGREVGKTPLTLEQLQPGEHSLLLLKEGHPRTARSVVLKPGDERVLEVKLGTAGSEEANDETKLPAPGESVAQAAKSVPVEVQLILTMLKEAVDKVNYSETRRNLALALSQPDMANFKEELCAAIRVVQTLEMRQHHIRKGAEALVGKEVTLRTKTGPRSGKVEGVSFEGIALTSKIMIEGVAAGETRGVIKWTALAQEEQERLAESWKPEGLDGAAARVILAQARKDRAAAEPPLASAGEHALGKYLGSGSAAVGPAEDDPNEAWAPLEKRCSARRITAADEVALDREIRAFKERHGKAGLDPSLRRRMSLAGKRAKRASALVGHWTFDQGGGSVARDWSGRGYHGRIQRGARWVKGKIDGALRFDGVRGHVRLPAGFADFRSGFTVALWANPTSHGNWARFIDFGNGAGGGNIILDQTDAPGNMRFHLCGDGRRGAWMEMTGSLAMNEWQHLAATLDGDGKAVFYRNGELVLSKQLMVPPSVTRRDNYIGKSNWRGNAYYEGLMDDVRIYNRALSAEEVKALAAQAE